MLQFFRSMLKSKLGVGIALAFLVLIVVAFASSDVASSGGFGGVAGGDRVASVGSKRISTADLTQGVNQAFEGARQDNPRLSLKAFVAGNTFNGVLETLVNRTALAEFGEQNGVVAGDRLVGSELAQIAAFKGPDGRFSEAAYRQLLRQRGLSDQSVRADIAQGIIARQLLLPAEFGATGSASQAQRFADVLTAKRIGAIALLPAAAFAPPTPPSDAELGAWYAKNKNNYIRPERRVVRYAAFDDTALKTVPAPTEAEIKARYDANKAAFAASEMRKVTQLVLPTEAAARAVLAEVTGGKSLEAAAQSKGLSASSLGSVSKSGLSGMSSVAVADAAFAGASGKVAGPARSQLGWHLVRVDAIETKAARTIDQVRPDLVKQLSEEKRRAALNDFTARIEEEFDNGASLADVAKELSVTIAQTAPLTGDGAVYGKPGETAPPVLAKVIQAAFAMESEGKPQVAEIEPGKTFLVFDVAAITASAPAPLAEIKNDVLVDLQLNKGAGAAKAAAAKVQAAVKKGSSLAAAMSGLGVGGLPPVDQVDMNREQLAKLGKQPPPPLALLFSMAKGTVKLLPAPRNRGWYVVQVTDIVPNSLKLTPQDYQAIAAQLGKDNGGEYAEQLRNAIIKQIGVTKNESAIKAVRNQLSGNSN